MKSESNFFLKKKKKKKKYTEENGSRLWLTNVHLSIKRIMHDSESCNLSALRNIFGFDTYVKKVYVIIQDRILIENENLVIAVFD